MSRGRRVGRTLLWEALIPGSVLAFFFCAYGTGASLLTFFWFFVILLSSWEYGLILGEVRRKRRGAKDEKF